MVPNVTDSLSFLTPFSPIPSDWYTYARALSGDRVDSPTAGLLRTAAFALAAAADAGAVTPQWGGVFGQEIVPGFLDKNPDDDKADNNDNSTVASSSSSSYMSEKLPENSYDVIVIGAGASGVGMGIMLTRTFGLEPERVAIIERGSAVGETFRQWPQEMRFISPSFNQQGWTKSFDLNSVVHGTSPAFTLHAEHPSGEQYATYLSALAKNAELNIKFGTEVNAVRPLNSPSDDNENIGFEVDVSPAAAAANPAVG